MPDNNHTYEQGYAKGYVAGRRKAKKEQTFAALDAKRIALWQRLFVAALPAAIGARNWKRGDKPITTLEDRTRLATEFADEGLRQALHKGKI